MSLVGGKVYVEGVLVQFNAAEHGGGIYAFDIDLTIKESLIGENEAPYGMGVFMDAGSLRIERSIVRGNHAPLDFHPGDGLYSTGASVFFSDSVFKKNDGTGLRIDLGDAQFIRTIVEGNKEGGLYLDTVDLFVDSGAVVGNLGTWGGIRHVNGKSTIRNSTIASNEGPGVVAVNATLINSTVTENRNGGLVLDGDSRLFNTIAANNLHEGGPHDLWVENAFAPEDAANNLIGSAPQMQPESSTGSMETSSVSIRFSVP